MSSEIKLNNISICINIEMHCLLLRNVGVDLTNMIYDVVDCT